MSQVKFYVTLNIADSYLSDKNYESTMDFIWDQVQIIADGLEGDIEDVEIK